jgi:hypothetical protein
MGYYESELKKIKKGEYAPTFKVWDGFGNQTKCIDINKESAEALVAWLKNNFINIQ